MKQKLFVLDDYKLTSVWAVKEGVKPEWEAQLNLYALMLREHGYRVDRLRIVAILRDWSKAKARHTRDYPQQPAVTLPVLMWTRAESEAYIKLRLIAHGLAQEVLPECTAEERWEKPAVWAVKKAGNVRALSLHPTREDAERALAALPRGNYSVIERPAEQKRCRDYCAALPWCEQGQTLIKREDDYKLDQAWSLPKLINVLEEAS